MLAMFMVLVSVEKLWSKRRSVEARKAEYRSHCTGPISQEQTSKPSESEIVAIRLLTTDGTQPKFDEWLAEPDRLKYSIDVFSQPSSSVQPLQVIFVLKNDEPVIVDMTEGTQNNLALDALLSYLHINSKQK